MNAAARWTTLLLTIMLGVEIGAGLYEARVVVPTWSSAPQAAYKFWAANAAYAQRAGLRWWMFTTPFTGLVALVATTLAGRLPSHQSKLIRIAGFLVLAVTAATFAYFVPTIIQLQSARVLDLQPELAMEKASLWAALNWLRATVYISAWLIVIHAVSLGPVPRRA